MANRLDREWKTAEGFPARQASGATHVALACTKGRMTRQPLGRPPLDPGGGRQWSRETLSKGSAAGTVFGDRCWCLLAHSSSRMGLQPRFSDPDRSLNRKRERFKGFEVGPRSNRGRTVMT